MGNVSADKGEKKDLSPGVILGAIIHPLPRRKPWEVARQSVTVDRLSNGRLVLPVGLGALDDAGVTGFGEPGERRVRAERLDESLEILTGLWSGDPIEFWLVCRTRRDLGCP